MTIETSKLWQLWPIVIFCENYQQLWIFVTIINNCKFCDNFEELWQYWSYCLSRIESDILSVMFEVGHGLLISLIWHPESADPGKSSRFQKMPQQWRGLYHVCSLHQTHKCHRTGKSWDIKSPLDCRTKMWYINSNMISALVSCTCETHLA